MRFVLNKKSLLPLQNEDEGASRRTEDHVCSEKVAKRIRERKHEQITWQCSLLWERGSGLDTAVTVTATNGTACNSLPRCVSESFP